MSHFRLTALGKKLFGWEKEMDGRRMHWAKLPLDLFNNPDFLALPDSQKLPFIGIGLLCVRHNNSVTTSVKSLRLALHLRVKPDLALYMAKGLIELDAADRSSHAVDKTRRDKNRTDCGPPPADRPKPEVSLVPALSWSNEAADDWIAVHGGTPPGAMFKSLGRLSKRVPWSRIRPVLRHYLGSRALDFLSWPKFADGFDTLEAEASGAPARASPKTAQTIRALREFVGEGDDAG